MLRWSGRMGLNAKVTLLGINSVLITAVALLALAVWQSGQYNRLAQCEVDRLIEADLDHIAQGIYNLAHAEDEVVQEQVDHNLNVARHALVNARGVRLSSESVVWNVVNPSTEDAVTVRLPRLWIGEQWLGSNAVSGHPSPIVDEVARLVGGAAAIFQRINERGDMLCVATTVTDKDGRREIGTCIPAVNPDNTPNPVIAAIRKGQTHHGRAFVADAWNLTAYAPITDGAGDLVGMLYVGVLQRNAGSRIRRAIVQTTVGKTGYVFVLSGQGQDRGHYIISQNGERDGEDIWETKDSDSHYVVQKIIKKALALKPGQRATIRYRWQNPGDNSPRWKIARLAYYQPWDWVIGASTYEDELQAYRSVLSGGRIRMTNVMGAAGLALTIVIGLFGTLMTWTITRPVRAMTKAVETITRGDLNQRVSIHSRDEIGALAQAFNAMTSRLAQTIEGLRASEEKYRDIFEKAIEGLFQTTLDGRFLSASPAMARILGYDSPEELIASVTDLQHQLYVHPKERDAILAPIVESDLTVEREVQLYRKDRHVIWGSLNIRAMRDNEGRILFLQGFLTDVTKRKRTEEELQRVSRLQSVILDNSTVGIALVRNRVFEWVNPRMPELFGIPQESFCGASTRIIYPDDDAYQKVGTGAYPLIAQGKKAAFEVEMRKGDGSLFWCRLEGNALDSSNPHDGSIWIWEDITERKRTEEALSKRIVALTQPLDVSEGIAFDDLFNVKDIQRIQDEFAAATGVASIITRPDGTPITAPSKFCRLCKDVIRQTEKGLLNCHRSDANLGRLSDGGPIIQRCLSGGLWDAGASIHVGGQHVANWLIGQVRDNTQTEDNMRAYAREIGVDENLLIEAFREVPAMSRTQFDQIAHLLFTIASQLSAMAYQNVQQSRFIADRQRAEEELRRHRDHLEETVRERTAELVTKNNELAEDIAERKRVERELQETSNYLNNLLDCANAPIMVWDPRLRITRFNHAFEQLTGRRAQEVLGHELGFLFPEDRRRECLEQIHRATMGERWEAVEIPIQHVDGTIRMLLCNSASLFEPDGRTVTSTIAQGQDITERKRLEGEALQRQKLESVGQLAAGIAHEINTPTQFVGDNIRFLGDAFGDLMGLIDRLDRLAAAAAAQESVVVSDLLDEVEQARTSADIGYLRTEIPNAVAQSLDGIQRVSKIVYAMKDFSHPDNGEKTATDLNRAIETTVTVARNEWKYVAEVDLQLDPTLSPVACYPGEINQVILNLIVNAAHAIEDKLGSDSTDKGAITISTKLDDDMVEIRVVDTGAGIPEQYRQRLFTPFFTTKSVGKGTGQGLAMAYNVIHKKHGGTIRFETEVGKGTTFIVRLPLSPSP